MISKEGFKLDRISSYFRIERITLTLVAVSGLLYNAGLLTAPWFEGRLAQCLADILRGNEKATKMISLVIRYIVVTIAVQGARFIKRFYVRRFANNINRKMKGVLYANLLRKDKVALKTEDTGELLTKAVSDVDDCSEGMRKFTTEVFDTGVAMACYATMLFVYDWRLAFCSLIFTPISYFCAAKMKKTVQRASAEYKKAVEELGTVTLDRVENAVTYRLYGCEQSREKTYERVLKNYKKTAIKSNVWQSALSPLYFVCSSAGVVFILWLGAKNVVGTGWNNWNIAAFTTFFSCFAKLTAKSSKAAKLFNSVQKAEVSWKRIKPLMKNPQPLEQLKIMPPVDVIIDNLSFAYEKKIIFSGLSLVAHPGEIIGVTGPVACGKSTLGKVLLGELQYGGSVLFGQKELKNLTPREIAGTVGYLGYDPELISDTLKNNVLYGDDLDVMVYLSATALKDEVLSTKNGIDTEIGNNGIRLSGGQRQRLALARTLAHHRPIMILDDPFSALDRKTEDVIFAKLQEYAKDKVVFLISHRLYHFPQTQKIIFMENGKTTVETHDRLTAVSDSYRRLYERQTGGGRYEEE